MKVNTSYLIFGLLIITVVFMSGCVQQENVKSEVADENTNTSIVGVQEPSIPENYQKSLPNAPQSQGLGSLCSGEEECVSFCHDNLGRCEGYCRGNKNELCRIIFPPGSGVDTSSPSEPEPSVTNESSNFEENEQVVVSNEVKFIHSIFDTSLVSHITPLGELNGGYEEVQTIAGAMINLKPEAFANGKEIEVRAPTNMALESYAYFRSPNDGQLNWALIFRISPELLIKFDHITRTTQKIIDGTTTTPKDNSREEYPRNRVFLTAGEVFAYTSGTSMAHNWNIYLTDTRHKNNFINSQRFTADGAGRRMLNAVCPFDFYSDEMKAGFLDLMGYSKAGQSATCGDVSRDVTGTLSGMWHFSSSYSSGISGQLDGMYASPLSVIKNSAGEITIDQVNNMRFDISSSNPTNKDPAEITGEHCYQLTNGYAYFKVVSSQEMQFAYSSSGSCPSSFPTTGAKRYYR